MENAKEAAYFLSDVACVVAGGSGSGDGFSSGTFSETGGRENNYGGITVYRQAESCRP